MLKNKNLMDFINYWLTLVFIETLPYIKYPISWQCLCGLWCITLCEGFIVAYRSCCSLWPSISNVQCLITNHHKTLTKRVSVMTLSFILFYVHLCESNKTAGGGHICEKQMRYNLTAINSRRSRIQAQTTSWSGPPRVFK